MPHMSPILWTVIMIMTFSLILILTSMIYFNIKLESPDSHKNEKESLFLNWKW